MAKSQVQSPPASPAPTSPSSPVPPNDNKPIHTIHYGNVRCLIWREESAKGVMFSVTVERYWQDKKGEHTGQTFLPADLQSLAKTAAETRTWVEWQQRRLSESH